MAADVKIEKVTGPTRLRARLLEHVTSNRVRVRVRIRVGVRVRVRVGVIIRVKG